MALITAARHNALQTRIATVLGTGSGDFGYGQPVQSFQRTVGATIDANDANALYNDLVKARGHQTGSTPGSISSVTSTTVITDAAWDAFESLMTNIENQRFAVASGALSAGTVSSRGGAWNNTVSHEFTVIFNNANQRRFFFNTGGEIRFSASNTGASNDKGLHWSTLLANMGVIKFGYTNTVRTGTGTGSSIGNYDLTTSYQQIFQKFEATSIYSTEYSTANYRIFARNISGSPNQIRFRVDFSDPADPGAGIDENVNGTLTSRIQHFRANSPYIVANPPAGYSTQSGL